MELCRLFDFKDLDDERGKLAVVEGAQDIPFEIKRVFYNKYMALTTRLSAESMRTRKMNLSLSMLPGNQRCALQTESASMLLSLTARCREFIFPKWFGKTCKAKVDVRRGIEISYDEFLHGNVRK